MFPSITLSGPYASTIPPPDYVVERHLFLSYPLRLRYLSIRGFTEPKVVYVLKKAPQADLTVCRWGHYFLFITRAISVNNTISPIGINIGERTHHQDQVATTPVSVSLRTTNTNRSMNNSLDPLACFISKQ